MHFDFTWIGFLDESRDVRSTHSTTNFGSKSCGGAAAEAFKEVGCHEVIVVNV